MNSVKIGNQAWTTKNLDVAYYCNGDPIPEVQDQTEWANLTTGARCYYANKSKNGKVYGCLYNWYAVNDPRGLVPKGWHIPDDRGWQRLVDYVGGIQIAGMKLKANGTLIWEDTDEIGGLLSGFSALPGGYRWHNGFYGEGKHSSFWSCTDINETYAWTWILRHEFSDVFRIPDMKNSGLSVRCVKAESPIWQAGKSRSGASLVNKKSKRYITS